MPGKVEGSDSGETAKSSSIGCRYLIYKSTPLLFTFPMRPNALLRKAGLHPARFGCGSHGRLSARLIPTSLVNRGC